MGKIWKIAILTLLSFLVSQAVELDGRDEWSSQIGGKSRDTGTSIAVDDKGSVYVSGTTNSPLDGHYHDFFLHDIFVLKYSGEGEKIWATQFGDNLEIKKVDDIAVDANGNVYVTGYAYGDLDGEANGGQRDIFLTKFRKDGTKAWTRMFGGEEWDEGKCLAIDKEGGIYVAGVTENSLDGHDNSGYYDIFLTKFDGNGRKIWTRLIGEKYGDDVWALESGSDGYIYMIGEIGGFPSYIYMAKFTRDGAKAWSRKLDAYNNGLCCYDFVTGIRDGDGNFILAGSTLLDENNHVGDYYDVVLAKFDSAGTFLWKRRFGSPYNDKAYDIACDGENAIYISGSSDGNLDGLSNTHEGTEDIFLTKFNGDGDTIGTKLYGSEADDEGYALAVRNGEIYVTGYTEGALEGHTNAGSSDIFITKFSSAGKIAPSGVDFNGDGTDDLLIRSFTGETHTLLIKADGTLESDNRVATIHPSEWRVEGKGDFNGDGMTDILVRNRNSGATYSWIMKSDGTRDGYRYITTIPETDWEIVGTGCDFNGDGVSDIVVRNKTHGWTYSWIMKSDGTRDGYRYITTIPYDQWEIAGVDSDFNGDGTSDLIVRKREEGWTYVWLMKKDGHRDRYELITNIPDAGWEIVGTDSDFNKDGVSDIVVRNRRDGATWIWLMNSDGSRDHYNYITKIPYERWEILGTESDFNRDGVSDLVVRVKEEGELYIWFMNADGSRRILRYVARIPADQWEVVQTKADLDRDGTSDILVRNLQTGTLYSWIMNIYGLRDAVKSVITLQSDEWTIE